MEELFQSVNFDPTKYVDFLALLLSDVQELQNGNGLAPKESLPANHVIERLQSHIDSGKIKCHKIENVPNRANLILEYVNCYNGPDDKTISIAGSHFDVVPADPSQWTKNPFSLTVEGDKLYGRGTTDCLGHVALVTLLLEELANNDIKLNFKFVVVFIADEEYGRDPTIGALQLDKDGHLDRIKNGPVYWLDSADIEPVLASGTGMSWKLKVYGKKAHCGFLHNGINPIPIAMEAVKLLTLEFNRLCPRVESDDTYGFKAHSNFKPTMWSMPSGSSSNQFADWVEVIGDVRMTPLYDPFKLKVDMLEFANSIDVEKLEKWHEHFSPTCGEVKAKLEFTWEFGPYCGVACDLTSKGYSLLKDATLRHHNKCVGCSDLGAVPLVKEMQDAGIDIQIVGYGVGDVYHGNDEYCTISGMQKGFNILKSLLIAANESE